MSSACAQLASRFDLAALANVSAEAGEILVINVSDVIDAECADLASWGETSATGATASRSTWSRTAVSAFARCLWSAEASTATAEWWTITTTSAAEGRTIAAAAICWSVATAIISIELRTVAAALSFFRHCACTFSIDRAMGAVER